MKKKLSLDADALSVTSFDTTSAPGAGRGTVRGFVSTECQPTPPQEADPGCTCVLSCLCETAAYYCATAPATAVSCDYTQNDSCFVTPNPTPPETLGC
jgi:hypothetical protein